MLAVVVLAAGIAFLSIAGTIAAIVGSSLVGLAVVGTAAAQVTQVTAAAVATQGIQVMVVVAVVTNPFADSAPTFPVGALTMGLFLESS